MMEFLSPWLQGIIISVVIATIIEMILPSGNSKKYVKVVLGVYIVFNIITPVINKLSNNDFELSSIINIEEYAKKMETYETASQNINMTETNELTIKQIYISKLEKDMKSKLEEKDYIVKNIKIEIEDDEEYTIKSVVIYIEEQEKNEDELQQNQVEINQIETVNIQVGNQINAEELKKESSISEQKKENIKEYLSSIYEINKKQITIY